MQLLPYRRYELVSAKTRWEVEAAMRAAVEPKRLFGFAKPTRPFEGVVGDGTFDVQQAIRYRNSFLPQIRGKISAAPEGSRIAVTMTLHPFVLVFMTIWLGIVGAVFFLTVVTKLRKGGSPLVALGPAIMFVFGWGMTVGCFTDEATKADRLLATTMMARPMATLNPTGPSTRGLTPGR